MSSENRDLTPVSIPSEQTIFNSTQVRFFTDSSGDLWVVAQDLAKALGLNKLRTQMSDLDADEIADVRLTDARSRQRRLYKLVSESAMYQLILRTRKPATKKFRKWVGEVIKTIRKTGRYEMPAKPDVYEVRAKGRDDILTHARAMVELRGMQGLDDRDKLMLLDEMRDLRRAIGDGSESSGIPISRYVSEHFGGRLTRRQLRGLCIRVGKLAAKTYRERTGADPPKREQHVDGATRLVSHYRATDFESFIHAIIEREVEALED